MTETPSRKPIGQELNELLAELKPGTSSDEGYEMDFDSVKNPEKLLTKAERIQTHADSLSLFSSNEDFGELPASSIRFMLLPGYVAFMLLTASSVKPRSKLLELCKTNLVSFLTLLKDYGLLAKDSETRRLLEVAEKDDQDENRIPKRPDRDAKIRRFRQEKDLKLQLSAIGAIDRVPSDDDDKRKFFKLELELWKLKAVAELEAILEELPLAKMMEKRISENGDQLPPPPPIIHSTTPSASVPRGLILTRTEAQKKVFGAGYPSLPSMTVEEWCEEQIAKGRIDLSGANQPPPPKEDSDEEGKVEETLERERKKKQEWDEYTDDHPRGWGNTYNRG